MRFLLLGLEPLLKVKFVVTGFKGHVPLTMELSVSRFLEMKSSS